jgi:hypothetical protein
MPFSCRSVVVAAAMLLIIDVVPAAATDTPGHPFIHPIDEGADCARLHELRNSALHHGAGNDQQQHMNLKLRTVGCTFDTTEPRLEAPPNTGTYTVNEYRIYREVMSAPMDMPESEALAMVVKKYNISPVQVRDIAAKVTRNLLDNDWMDVLEMEIRHASDWKDEKQ